MRTKDNASEYFPLRPLGRLCRQVAFKLDRISTEWTGEVRMIQEKQNCEQRWKQQVVWCGSEREGMCILVTLWVTLRRVHIF